MSMSEACAHSQWDEFPAAVQGRAVDLVADTLAVAALGSGRPEIKQFVGEYGRGAEGGVATVVGSSRGWSVEAAAFLNASAGATDQLQDGHRLAKGHPASHVIPVAFALAEQHDIDGTEMLASVVAGYEVGTRVGMAMGGTPSGVHDIGTWGVVAVAATVARMLRPGDAEASERAINLAASAVLLTDAQTIFQGKTGGHAFLGVSAQLGLSLGQAAVAGLSALPGALERHLATVAGLYWNAEPLTVDGRRWNEFEMLRGYMKVHPTCAHLHGVNDSVADIIHNLGAAQVMDLSEIADIEVRTFRGASAFDAIADNELAARFSIPTSVAIALTTGILDESTVIDDVIRSERVMNVAKRVRVLHDPALDAGYPAGRPSAVLITLKSGEVLNGSCGRPRGDDDRALTRSQVRAKATRLLRGRFGARSHDVLRRVDDLAHGASVRELGSALREAAEALGDGCGDEL